MRVRLPARLLLAGVLSGAIVWPVALQAQTDNCRIDVVSLAVNPQDPSVVYAGTGSDGLFVSTDAVQSWKPSTEPRVSSVSSIAIDPRDPGRFFVSTYEEFLHGTVDGGRNWELLNRGITLDPCGAFPCINLPSFQQIAIDPFFPQLLFARTFEWIYRSEDGGRIWSRLDFARPNPLLWTDTRDGGPFSIYMMEFDSVRQSARLRVSKDRGVTWSATGGDLDAAFRTIESDPRDPTRLYGASWKGIYRSMDGGVLWSKVYPLPPDRLPVIPPSESFDIVGLAVDPRSPDRVYAAGFYRGVFKSVDSGLSWVSSKNGLENAGVNAVVVDPTDSSVLYAGTTNGVFKSTNGGETWRSSFALGETPEIVGVDPPELLEESGGASGGLITVKGKGFSSSSGALWNGSPRRTTFLSCASLLVGLSSDDLKSPGTARLQVINLDGSTSSGFAVQIRPKLARRPFPGSVHVPRTVNPR